MGLPRAKAMFPHQPPTIPAPSQQYHTAQPFSGLGAATFFSQESIGHPWQPNAYFAIHCTGIAEGWRLIGTPAFLKVEKKSKTVYRA